jgi:hypothetical protein
LRRAIYCGTTVGLRREVGFVAEAVAVGAALRAGLSAALDGASIFAGVAALAAESDLAGVGGAGAAGFGAAGASSDGALGAFGAGAAGASDGDFGSTGFGGATGAGGGATGGSDGGGGAGGSIAAGSGCESSIGAVQLISQQHELRLFVRRYIAPSAEAAATPTNNNASIPHSPRRMATKLPSVKRKIPMYDRNDRSVAVV